MQEQRREDNQSSMTKRDNHWPRTQENKGVYTILDSSLVSMGSQTVAPNSSNKPKKKYSSRMRQLAPHVTSLSQTYHYRSGDSPQLESVRARNNAASQSSRARKKMYMKLLEDQVLNFQLQLQETSDQIQIYRTQIFNALMHTDEVNSQNAQIQSHVIKKLKSLVQSQKSAKNSRQINICLDSCLYRIGASGSQRKAILDILYKGMINRNLPNIYRYILWSAANETHLFRNRGEGRRNPNFQNWWNEIKEVGEEVIQKNEGFLKERGKPLGQKAKQILQCSRHILQKKQEIEDYGQAYDSILKTFRQILTPVQFAELFLFVERSIHKKELQLLQDEMKKTSSITSPLKRSLCNDQPQEENTKVTKKVKRQ